MIAWEPVDGPASRNNFTVSNNPEIDAAGQAGNYDFGLYQETPQRAVTKLPLGPLHVRFHTSVSSNTSHTPWW